MSDDVRSAEDAAFSAGFQAGRRAAERLALRTLRRALAAMPEDVAERTIKALAAAVTQGKPGG